MKRSRDGKASPFFRRLRIFTRRTERSTGGFRSWLRNRFAIGLLVAFPLVVTFFFARFIFTILDRWFRPISAHFLGFPLVGGGLLLAVIALLLLGIVATNVFGGRLLGFFEARITDIPLLSPIYKGARQITEAIQARESTEFQRVVLIRFPHKDVRSVAFVTREFKGATAFADEPTALVFVPTTPNPTSGFLVSALQSNLINLDISVEEGVKLVISGGLLTPTALIKNKIDLEENEPTLDDGKS